MISNHTMDNADFPTSNLLPLLIGFALISAFGLAFGLHSLVVGHHHTFGTTREVPWGILITPYFFFACLSTGLCIVSSLGQVFNVKAFQPIVSRTVFLAIITMATGLMCITLELENPWRVGFYSLFSPHPSSNIWWKTTIYSFYLIFMIFNFILLLLKRQKQARIFATIAFVLVTLGNLNMNSDMAILGTRGFWSENYMPLYFLSLSTLTGCAAILFFFWFSKKIGGQRDNSESESENITSGTSKLFMGILVGILYFTAVKMMGGFFPQFTKNPEAMFLLVRGSFALNFWLGEVGLAVLLPFLIVLITRGKNPTFLAIAGLSCLIGSFILFYDLVIVGQLIPHYHQYHVVGLPEYYSYTPSLHESMITMGAVFFFLAAFIGGEMILRKFSMQ